MAHARLTREMDRRLSEAGLISLEVYDVLVILEYQEGYRMKMSDLAAQANFSKSGLTRLVDRLQKKGWIHRERCEEDRRVSYAILTAEGKKMREAAWPTYRASIAELFGDPLISDDSALIWSTKLDEMADKAHKTWLEATS